MTWDRVVGVNELGPQTPPIGWPQVAASNSTLSQRLDLHASFRRNWPLVSQPLPDRLWTHAEGTGQRSVATEDPGCSFERHAPERKAILCTAQEALLPLDAEAHYQAMLPKGKELGEKIRLALALAKVQPADAARIFGVTPQAVNGWFRTGRIDKNKLLEIVRITCPHVAPGYWQDAKIVEIAIGKAGRAPTRSERRPDWPFATDEQSVCHLPADVLALIDLQLSHHIKQHLPHEPRRRARQS